MSTPTANKERMQQAFAALAHGDGRPFLDCMADDVVWTIPGCATWSGRWEGKRAVRKQLLEPVAARFAGTLVMEPSRFVAEDDIVVVESRGRVAMKSGRRYDNTYCFVFRWHEGRVVELTEYQDTELSATVLGPP